MPAGAAESNWPSGTVVWRRAPPWHFPKKPRQDRPDSAAFDDDGPDEPMSVVVARPGRAAAGVLVGHEGFALVALSLGALEEAGQRLVPDPLDDEADHALVVGNKSLATKRRLAKAAVWVVRPLDAFPPQEPTTPQ